VPGPVLSSHAKASRVAAERPLMRSPASSARVGWMPSRRVTAVAVLVASPKSRKVPWFPRVTVSDRMTRDASRFSHQARQAGRYNLSWVVPQQAALAAGGSGLEPDHLPRGCVVSRDAPAWRVRESARAAPRHCARPAVPGTQLGFRRGRVSQGGECPGRHGTGS
jgi:hypothetical protein